MKRKIALFLALTLVFSAFFALSPISAYAEETEYTDLYDDSSLLGKYSPAEIYEANKDACDFIAAQVRELKEVINLRSYNLDSNHMGEIFYSVICENPDIFYVLSSTISTTSTMDDFVVSIQPEYTFNKAQIPSEIEKFNAASAKFLSGVDSGWSDIVKARYIHDLLAQYTEYEMDYGSISSADPDFYDKMRIYTSYGPIVNGVAVCEGYTMAYNYLLARVGIRGYSVRSAVARHAWSIVKIGASYYHVDVTHDDPIYDNLGRSAHNNFLKSDTYFANDGDDNHVRWIFGEKASDTSYDSYWWNDVDTAIYPYSGKEYYIDQNYNNQRIFALVARDSSDKISDVYVNSDRWYVKNTPGAVWSKSFGYLTADNKYFYFNDTSRVYRLEKGKTQPEVIYTKPDAEQRDLFGLAFKGSDLYAALKENPNTADEVTKVYTPEVPTEPTTEAPSTAVPTTAEPTTEAPTTAVPTTAEPTTEAPTTTAPTTAEPTTEAPTTAAPTTAEPTTEAPTTAAPTTAEPTTEAPTTAAPTTAEPTTEAPTTYNRSAHNSGTDNGGAYNSSSHNRSDKNHGNQKNNKYVHQVQVDRDNRGQIKMHLLHEQQKGCRGKHPRRYYCEKSRHGGNHNQGDGRGRPSHRQGQEPDAQQVKAQSQKGQDLYRQGQGRKRPRDLQILEQKGRNRQHKGQAESHKARHGDNHRHRLRNQAQM